MIEHVVLYGCIKYPYTPLQIFNSQQFLKLSTGVLEEEEGGGGGGGGGNRLLV